jgi:hypothetical protein
MHVCLQHREMSYENVCIHQDLEIDFHDHNTFSNTLLKTKLKLNSVACSPQANYIDRAAAACQRS